MSKDIQKVAFLKDMQKVAFLFDCEVTAINAAVAKANHKRLAELMSQYREYATSRRASNRNLWALLYEMAKAAAELSLFGLDVTCRDCGELFTQRNPNNYGDTDHVCRECGEDRMIRRADEGRLASYGMLHGAGCGCAGCDYEYA